MIRGFATSDENDGYDSRQPIAAAGPFKCLGGGDEKTNNSPFQMAETVVGEAITAFFRTQTIFRGAATAREPCFSPSQRNFASTSKAYSAWYMLYL